MHEVMIRIGEEGETMSLRCSTRDEALAVIFSLYDPFMAQIDDTAIVLDTLAQCVA